MEGRGVEAGGVALYAYNTNRSVDTILETSLVCPTHRPTLAPGDAVGGGESANAIVMWIVSDLWAGTSCL